MKIRLRIIVMAFCLSFSLLIGLTFYATTQFIQFNHTTSQVDKTNRSLTQLHIIKGLLKDIDLYEKELPYQVDSNYKRVHNFLGKLSLIDSSIKKYELVAEEKLEADLTMLKSNLALRKSLLRQRVYQPGTLQKSNYDSMYSKLLYESNLYIDNLIDTKFHELDAGFSKRDNLQNRASGSITYLLLFFFAGTLVLFFLMMYEFKLRSRYREELQANLANLKNAHMELEQVAFSMSHHLREPMRKIRIFADRLQQPGMTATPEAKDMARRIDDSAGTMQQLIKHLETLSSFSKEALDVQVDLEEITDLVTYRYRETIKNREAVINIANLPTVYGNKDQLEALFSVILDNALKFSKPGKPPVINIESTMQDGSDIPGIPSGLGDKKYHKISIADNGIGFEEEYSNKVFDLFQRLHSSEVIYPGKGAGLTIARRIMGNHKGYINAEAQPGKGATINLYFPVLPS